MPKRGGPENEQLPESAVISETGRKKIDRKTFISEVTERLQVVEDAIGEHQVIITKFNAFADRVRAYNDLNDWLLRFYTNEKNIIVKAQLKQFGFVAPQILPDANEADDARVPKFFDINGPLTGKGSIFLPDEVAAQLDLTDENAQYSVEDLMQLGGQVIFDEFVIPQDYKQINSIEYWMRMNKLGDALNEKKAQLESMRTSYIKTIEDAVNSENASGVQTSFYRDSESRELYTEMRQKANLGFIKNQE